jgi:hypothetical protein
MTERVAPVLPDQLIRSLLALGATDRDLAEVIMGKLAKAS